MRVLFSCYFTVIFAILQAENPCGIMFPQTKGIWGKSCIWIKIGESLKTYDSPNGQVTGNLKFSEKYWNLRYNPDTSSKQIWIDELDKVWIGSNSIELLRVSETNSGYHKIMNSTFSNGLWINSKDIDEQKYFHFSYQELLFGKKEELPKEINWGREYGRIGVNLENCLNLRESPSIKSKIITCVPSNGIKHDSRFVTHVEVIKSQDKWAYVNVITNKYPSTPDEDSECPSKLYRQQKGWLKAIGDDGYPNIWYSVTTY